MTTASASASVGSNETSAHESGQQDPWSHPRVEKAVTGRRARKTNKARFRQHVNPLASRYQQPCALPNDWPQSAFRDATLPLHVDIGCGKGGFLMDVASAASRATPRSEEEEESPCSNRSWRRNYLGLEIRPLVAQYALERLALLRQQQDQHEASNDVDGCWTDRVHFLGCNVNVDLDRILGQYRGDNSNSTALEMVTLQFPDPHFKSYHAKRRVVNSALVCVLAKHLSPGIGQVFLQSDIQSVLDDMRQQFAAHPAYFADQSNDPDRYYPRNVFDIPTEREVSVLEKGLPVYRALFTRTVVPFDSKDPEEP
jgi:tRNA (guanine-N7-)-methyltransferase